MRYCFNFLRGCFLFLCIVLSSLLHGALLILCAPLKMILPRGRARRAIRQGMARIAESWVGVNNLLLRLVPDLNWRLDVPRELDRQGCYLVISNHQTWVDIVVLQRCFNGTLPLMRFFLKRELIWVPVLGLCWWALDFPFMRRASREEIARRPELKGQDLESARKACEKFRAIPVAMMNFVEGTRRAGAKRVDDGPYRYLLPPRAGGVGQVLYALGDQLAGCVDVTISYALSDGRSDPPTMWELLTNRITEVQVHANLRSIPESLLSRNFRTDLKARAALNDWVDGMWREKDELLKQQARRSRETGLPP